MKTHEASQIVATGRCPKCHAPLVPSKGLPGSWECAAAEAPRNRPRIYRHLPKCSFQVFVG